MYKKWTPIAALLSLFVTTILWSQVTGFKEDFNDNILTGWEAPNSGTFALTETNGTLRIGYNRTAASTEWDNFNFTPPLVDVGAAPYITLKVRSSVACELVFKPIYSDGNDNWLPQQLPGDNTWHDYTFTLAPGGETVINRIYMYLDGGTTAPQSGVVYFDDLFLGDAAVGSISADRSALISALAAATSLHLNSADGSGEGEYPAGARAALLAEIDRAQAVANKANATQVELDQTEWDLLDACVELEKQANIPNPGLIDPLASPKTKYLYQNLEQGCGQRLLFGMHDATGYGVGWKGDDNRSDVKDVCGDYPALYGWDMNKVDRGSAQEMARFTYRIKSAFARGGVNTLCWHQYDPRGRSFYGRDISDNVVITLLPGGTYHDFYKNRLIRIARFLKGLRGQDGHSIPIIFRPYHEHDSGAFWWGTNNCSAEEYNRIWQFTVTFLRDSLNVHNLIYAISPISFTTRNSYLKIYPGDDYIDILGMDFYYWAPLDQRQTAFINTLHIPVELARERAKVAALTEVGYENLPEPAWFNRYLLPPFITDPLAAQMSYAMVWRNESTNHFFAPYPGHATVPGFIDFYNDPRTTFESDLPPMYIRPGSDVQPPRFTIQPDSFFVSTDTLVTLYLETDERAHLRYGGSDLPYGALPQPFINGQGGFKHSTTIALGQGIEETLYVRAIDLSGNEIPQAVKITIKVDTLQRNIPWYDERYPTDKWKNGIAPLGYGGTGGNTTVTAAAKTLYFVTTFSLPQLVDKLGLLVKCHDGAVVYLNNQELTRFNMPDTLIQHGTAAKSVVKTNSIYMFTPAAIALLKTGTNHLAVEIHSAEVANPDLSFDARVFDATTMYLNLGSAWRCYDGDQLPPVYTLADFLSTVHGESAQIPHEFTLMQNYPNPFNPETIIRFHLGRSAAVRLEIFDLTGRLVTMLYEGRLQAGEHQVLFRGDNLASGVYFYRLTADKLRIINRMLLLR